MPHILPDIQPDAVTPLKIIRALSAPAMAIEAADGWMATQLATQRRSSGSMNADIRRFRAFIVYLDFTLDRFGLGSLRSCMTVSGRIAHASPRDCTNMFTVIVTFVCLLSGYYLFV